MQYHQSRPSSSSTSTKSLRGMFHKRFAVLTLVGLVGFSVSMRAQGNSSQAGTGPLVDPVVQQNILDWAVQRRGLPADWTHHYLVFSNPGTAEQATASGNYEHWLKVVNSPRFTMQQIKRSGGVAGLAGWAIGSGEGPTPVLPNPVRPGPVAPIPPIKWKNPIKKDWNVQIGGTVASATGTITPAFSASGSSTVTINGTAVTGSAPAAATATGTFTASAPASGKNITITNTSPSNVLTLGTNATTESSIATVGAVPSSNAVPTLTLTNSAVVGSNALVLTTNMSAATVTATFAGTSIPAGDTLTINNGTSTLTLTPTITSGSFTVTGLLLNTTLYIYPNSYSILSNCSSGTAYCVVSSSNFTNMAQNIVDAVAGNCAGNTACGSATPKSIWEFATLSGPTVTLTNISGSLLNWSETTGISPLTGTIAVPANDCTSATTGTFGWSNNTTNSAWNLNTTLSYCHASYPSIGFTSTWGGANVDTLTSTTVGPTPTFTFGGTGVIGGDFAWSATTANGSWGSNGCTSSLVGTFASGATTATVASNIAAAITSCNSSYSAVGLTASYTSGSTFTVANPTPGPYLTVLSGTPADVSFATATGGSAGSNTCTGNTTGTFATSLVAATLATNVAAAINGCTAATTGVTAGSGGATLTLTAKAAGPGGNSIALTNTLADFSWTGGSPSNLSGGTCGSNSGSLFAYQYGASTCTVDSTAQLATSIANAINANSTLAPQVTAVPSTSGSNGIVTVTANALGTGGDYTTAVASFTGFSWSGNLTGGSGAARVQPNMFPATYSLSETTSSCSDFVIYPTGFAGAANAADIVAFNNIYSGQCTGVVPSAFWAYNTGGTATTSPALSLDGTQVAFIQVSGTTATLVILRPAAGGNPASPVTLTSTGTGAAYQSCKTGGSGPCMYSIAFGNGKNVTYSAPFYYYDGDIIYVGDDSGNLHQFTGVFHGVPAETGSPWPVSLSTTKALAPPVFDETSGLILVGDFAGILHAVTAATGAIHATSVSLGDVIADAPLVDGNAQYLYAFVTTGNSALGESGFNVIFQFDIATFSGTNFQPTNYEGLKFGKTGYYLYAGTFDNVYYSSSNPQAPSGNIYTLGDTGGNPLGGGAWLVQIPIASNVMGAGVTLSTNITFNGTGATYPFPSPVTEFCNNGASLCTSNGTITTAGTDYIFFSVNRGLGCTNTGVGYGCVEAYNVTNPASVAQSGTGLNVTTPGTNGCWATGGIVVDNSSTSAGASQIYFVGLGVNAAGAAGGASGGATGGTVCSGTTPSTTILATQASQSNP